MPAYDYRCPDCGHEEELIHSVAECDDEHPCPACLRHDCASAPGMRRIIHPAALHGAIFDKKIQYGNITFESNAAARQYLKDNPGLEPVSTSSKWWQDHKDENREAAEAQAVKQGWRDIDERNSVQKSYRDKGLETPSMPSEM